jgi:23S rRNA-/tRNA-specific pseudouridylate synthase
LYSGETVTPEWVFRDEWIAVIHKPPGMPVQSTRRGAEGTLEPWLKAHDGIDYVAFHHRLDAAAQGLLVVGLHPHANPGLAREFRERRAVRKYRALVHGEPGSQGEWRHVEGKRGGERVALPSGPGRHMVSRWTLLEQRGSRALIEVRLHTGRTHQIRLQAAAEGMPVVGDIQYGFGERGGLRLQAYSLEFTHPVTHKPVHHVLPVPLQWG